MRVADLPRDVRKVPEAWIEMPDGARLAATLWLPEGAVDEPVPAVLEYIPYRRRDFTAPPDALMHPYFAGHGYAAVRVDMRGSGDSDGLLLDEYLPQEQEDGLSVLRWIAEQPWCDGNVGIIGISWGGFNGLQIAARRPPELKAVVSVASTDDRYADDIHHMGGCVLSDNLSWAAVMFAYNSLPPDPAVVGDRWEEMWHERLEANEPWLNTWLRHQRRDAYWSHGSVCEDHSAIEAPVLLVSGWADGYSNAVFRMLEHLDCPRQGLVGPWSHRYPHDGLPGPAVGFLQECVRWWDRWLRGEDNGVSEEPALRAWMQDSVPPFTQYVERPGRWIAEDSWPSPRIREVRHPLSDGRLEPPEAESTAPRPQLKISSPLGVGLFAGKWSSYGGGPDLAGDQRWEDGGALVFDGDPQEEPLDILGRPYLYLRVASSRPVAMVAVRLSDVAPDGAATRLTYGLLNLTHRNDHADPEPLEPGRPYDVLVRLNELGHRIPAGHRLRVALSTSYWPLTWPAPEPVMLTVDTAHSHLTVPRRPPREEDHALRPLGEPEAAAPLPRTMLEPEEHVWRVLSDLGSDVSTLEVVNDRGRWHDEEHDLVVANHTREWYRARGNDVLSVRGETLTERELARGDWRVRTVTRIILTVTRDHFHLDADIDAFLGDARAFCRTWNLEIPRDHV